MSTNALLRSCQIGYIALIFLLSGRFIGQTLNGEYSELFNILFILPLFLPIKGIMKATPYTFAWGSFILCLYMLHGLTLIYVDKNAFLFALLEITLISLLLIGFPFYARLKGRELGLGLKK